VTLTAANPAVADDQAPSYPAVVNHVVFRRRGILQTVLRGFKITGARNFTSGIGEKSPSNQTRFERRPFLHRWRRHQGLCADPIRPSSVDVFGNYTSPCGGGVSVEHLGVIQESVLFRIASFATIAPRRPDPPWTSCMAATRRS
jgi:hypothetical protein